MGFKVAFGINDFKLYLDFVQEGVLMKSFVYLDMDTVNSYIAQIDDGLRTLQTKTTQLSNEKKKQQSHSLDGEGDADFTVLGKGIEAKIDYIYNRLSSNTYSKLYSDVETKVLHDNAFRQVMEHLSKNCLIASGNPKIGEFIDIEGDIHLLDLEYYKSLFNEDDFIKLINAPKKEEVNKVFEGLVDEENSKHNRDTRRSTEYRNAIKEIENKKRQALNDIDVGITELRNQLELLLKLFPYKLLMSVDNYIAVFDEKYLRDDIQKAPFKYGGRVHLVGYVTNTTSVNEKSSIFSGPMDMINGMIKTLFDAEKELYIVHPIAIYYE